MKVLETREDIQKKVLCSITKLNPHRTETCKSILKEFQSSSDVSIEDKSLLETDNIPTVIDESTFPRCSNRPKNLITQNTNEFWKKNENFTRSDTKL